MPAKAHPIAICALIAGLFVGALAQAGPIWEQGGYDVVAALETLEYVVTFRGGEYALVEVYGSGASDLDLYVYDEDGNLVELDTDPTDFCIAGFTPEWTAQYTIAIVNRGEAENPFELVLS